MLHWQAENSYLDSTVQCIVSPTFIFCPHHLPIYLITTHQQSSLHFANATEIF